MNVGEPTGAGAALAVPVPRPDTAKPSAVLPDTLRISLPERNPASVWPRMEVVPALEYPAAARGAGVQGVVWVTTLVDVDGSVRTAHVDHGGIPGLNEAALAWVRRARFAPCERDGQPYQFWVRVAARFVP
jgi:TonB family protein